MKFRALSVLALGGALALTAGHASADDLVLWLSLDEGTGSTAVDQSGFGNDAAFFGNPQWVDGVYGKGFGFDGATWGEIPDSDSLDLTDTFTMSAWALVNPGGEAIQSAMEKGPAWGAGEYNLAALYNGGTILQAADLPAACADTNSGASIQDGTWHYLAGVLDGAEIKIYIDGVLDASMACVGSLTPNDGALYIGARGGTGRFLNGALDELHIYDYPLSAGEIEDDMELSAPVEARGKATTAWGSLKAIR